MGQIQVTAKSLLFAAIFGFLGAPGAALAQTTWSVTLKLEQAQSFSDDDADGPDDLYWEASVIPTMGSGNAATCSTEKNHQDDNNLINPGWVCSTNVTGGPNTTLQINIALWDHDTTSGDDHFDINPGASISEVAVTFKPADFSMVMNVAGFEQPQCAPGIITTRGFSGDDFGEIKFSISASSLAAPDGDSDGDGLADSAEVCGLDQNSDNVVDVDLPGMGADLFRKDAFVEIDWMLDNSGVAATQHSHEPWLPSLINAWEEFNALQITNPGRDSGVALHLDVGDLYAGYQLDFDGDGIADLSVPSDGFIDVDGDGIDDIGPLGLLTGVGTGTVGGGNALPEQAMLADPPGGGAPLDPGSDFQNIKMANFDALRAGVFRYDIFGHSYAANPGSSGREECNTTVCDDFLVSLGGWARQTVDANRDGVPDPAPAAIMTGPSGLEVDGTFADHTGTFMHEFGHTMNIHHGGTGDTDNFKPNYLSIMNYRFQIDGLAFDFDADMRADVINRDFDHDGILDLRSHAYSAVALPSLDERPLPAGSGLDEGAGVGGQNTLTQYTCPTPAGVANPTVRANGAVDWDCDMAIDPNPVSVNVNAGDGMALSLLRGADDHAQIGAGGLDFGITLDEYRALLATSQRIVDPSRFETVLQCENWKLLDFEDLRMGDKLAGDYQGLAYFAFDGNRQPVVYDDIVRPGGAITQSPHNSLTNEQIAGTFAPMSITFTEPQQEVSLFAGRTPTSTISDALTVRAVLEAFDLNDLSMGTVSVPLAPNNFKIRTSLRAAAIFPDMPIKRVELRYELPFNERTGSRAEPIVEPQQIDSLKLCTKKEDGPVVTVTPPPITFGDLPAVLSLRAIVVTSTGAPIDLTEADHFTPVETPAPYVPLSVDGVTVYSGGSVSRDEGKTVQLEAPGDLGPDVRFEYWRYGDHVALGEGLTKLDLNLVRSATLTAVYSSTKPYIPQRPE